MSSVQKLSDVPAPTSLPMNTNKSISDTPVTISGFIIGMFVTLSMSPFAHFERILYMPTAASVPSRVAITADASARTSVFLSAVMVPLLANSSRYHLS